MMRSGCHLVGQCVKAHVVGMWGDMEQTRCSMVGIKHCPTASMLLKHRLIIAIKRCIM